MPDYLLHRRGRGRLYNDAEANRATYLDRTSSASGSAKLRNCKLIAGSRAEDDCQIFGGHFTQTFIKGKTIIAGNPQIVDSTINCVEVSGTPYIEACLINEGTEICDSPRLLNVVTAGAIIYGNPILEHCAGVVTGRIHEGHWTRAPKHVKLPWVEMTECIDGKLILACRCRTIVYWLRHGAKLARRWDWSEDQIDVTLATIRAEFGDGRLTWVSAADRVMGRASLSYSTNC